MTKISQLSDIGAGLAAGDEFVIRDVSDATTPNKKVTASGFMDYVISQSTSGNFSTISAGTGPLSRVQTTFSGATGTITFDTASAGSLVERLRITSAGLVGIGTTAPSLGLLEVSSTNGVTLAIKNTTGTTVGSEFCQLTFNNTSNSNANFESAKIKAISTNGGANLAHLTFENSGSERARIDSSGRLLVGTSSSRSTAIGDPQLQVEGTTYGGSSIQMICNSAADATTCAHLAFGRSKTTAIGGTGQVASGDRLGAISWNGAQNSTLSSIAGLIECYVDGEVQTAGDTTDMPGRLVFSTTADGASSPTERMRITSTGNVLIGKSSGSYKLDVSEARVGDGYVIYSKVLNKASATTHTATISFGTAGNHRPKHVAVTFVGSSGTTIAAGTASYFFTTLTTVGTVTELSDTGNGVTFAATTSGLDLIITATTTNSMSFIAFTAQITGDVATDGAPTGMAIA